MDNNKGDPVQNESGVKIKEEKMDVDDNPEYVNPHEISTISNENLEIKHEEIEIKTEEPEPQPEPSCSSKDVQRDSPLRDIQNRSKLCQTELCLNLNSDEENEEFQDEDASEEYRKRYEKFLKLESYLLNRDPNSKAADEEFDSNSINSGMIYQFMISLMGGIHPRVWRRIQVPGSFTFRELHVAIQKSMGWESGDYDYHLHLFHLEHPKHGFDIDLGEPFDDVKDENKFKIFQLIDKNKNKKFIYEYDLGFGWEHEITLENIIAKEEDVKYPRCIDGARACPPEDVGSLGRSYSDFCEAVNNKNHRDHQEVTRWLERDHFDPEKFDAKLVVF